TVIAILWRPLSRSCRTYVSPVFRLPGCQTPHKQFFISEKAISTKPFLTLASIIIIGHGSYSLAQPNGDVLLEEVMVTAQKRSQNIRDIGVTMSALDAGQLRLLAVETLPDLANTLSNVQLFQDYGGNGLAIWVIRGVGLQDFNANNTTTAAIYVDDVYQVSS